MAGAKTHDYHILPPSIWPFIGSMSALVMAVGGVMWLHEYAGGGYVFLAGVAGILFTMFSWWSDVLREAPAGAHPPAVQLYLGYGLRLFFVFNVMCVFGCFL